MENVAVGFAYRPKAVLAILMAGILPDQNRPGENPGTIVKADTAIAQRICMLGLIPLEFHMGMLRLKRTPPQGAGHQRSRPSRFAITDSGSGRAVCGFRASAL